MVDTHVLGDAGALALLTGSLAIGALSGRVWTVGVPFVVLAISLPVAFLLAEGHELVDLMVSLPALAILCAVAVAVGLGARRLARRLAGRS